MILGWSLPSCLAASGGVYPKIVRHVLLQRPSTIAVMSLHRLDFFQFPIRMTCSLLYTTLHRADRAAVPSLQVWSAAKRCYVHRELQEFDHSAL
jgi:hypothetical protein